MNFRKARDEWERDFFLLMLAAAKGNVTQCAQTVGLERSYLHRKMQRLGIKQKGTK